MKKRYNTIVEREGINFIRSAVESANCIFHEIHKENDFGIDGMIELVRNEIVTGKHIAVQIKSGASYCTNQTCTIPADKDHFQYWNGHSLPVVGIVYDPEERCGYWINIKGFLKAHTNYPNFNSGPYSINFDKSILSRFDEDMFTRVFIPVFTKETLNLDYSLCVNLTNDIDFTLHETGLETLFRRYRHLPQTWDLLLELFDNRSYEETSDSLIYTFALIPGHPDIYWSKDNIISSDIKSKMSIKLAQLNKTQIIKLFRFVDSPFDFQRGSMGQCVEAIIGIVENRDQILVDIIQDESVILEVRLSAALLLAFYKQKSCLAFLTEVAEKDEKFAEEFEFILQHLNTYDYLSLFS